MKPITRKEFYLAKAAGTYTGPTPPPVLSEDYYLATLAGDYSGYCPAPVTRLDMFMSAAAELTSYVPQPITRLEMYWYAIAKGAGYVPEPVTREEKFLYAILKNPPKPEYLDKTAEGSLILLPDSAEAPLTALTVYGHSTQDGTPSPENPVPIVNIGDSGTINITLSDSGSQSQTLPVSTPNGLPGIPVDSDGNYTDENGQQWVCNEIDLKRGKYVQRVKKIVPDISKFVLTEYPQTNTNRFGYRGGNLSGIVDCILCTISRSTNSGSVANTCRIYKGNTIFLFLDQETFPDIQTFSDYYDKNPFYFYVGLAEPIETDLTAEEIAAYKALHTYSPTTTVSNDAGAWMKVGYKANP